MYLNKSLLARVLVLSASFALSGCDWIVMKPHGDIAQQQAQLIVTSTLLMLLIIVPVIALTLLFAYRYRQSNAEATYAPDWDHSTRLELVIWGAPLLIIIALGAITWISTHTLDPYRPLSRLDAERPIPAEAKPLVVEVVALDWKWLFIYPEQGFATVNEMAAPVMNSFFIPALAGQIYAMPGMETKLHAVINKPGEFEGFSANYSGAGFSGMRFKFHGLSNTDFDQWVQKVKAGKDGELTREQYKKLEVPSEREPVRHYATVAPDLYDAILNLCVDRNKMCMKEMMAIDASGGLGKPGAFNIATMQAWQADTLIKSPTRKYVTAMCTTEE
jgi:cytochrome o ubiquinol oxidase subunit 2